MTPMLAAVAALFGGLPSTSQMRTWAQNEPGLFGAYAHKAKGIPGSNRWRDKRGLRQHTPRRLRPND